MSIKLLNPGHAKTRGYEGVISARKAAEKIGVATNTFFKELESDKSIYPQAKIDGDPRPAYGFVHEYLEEVAAVLGKDRLRGQLVFTTAVREKIKEINKRWIKKYPNPNSSN